MLSYNLNYLYTKIPLSVFKIKIEKEKRDKIFVNDIHLFSLLAYKSNGIFKKTITFVKQKQNEMTIVYKYFISFYYFYFYFKNR